MSNDHSNPFRLRRVERMADDEIRRTYCQPQPNVRLTDSRNVILQGARGSGKSTVLRAVTDSPSPDGTFISADNALVVGTYISLGQTWVAGFQRRHWISSDKRSVLFDQALNLYIAEQFVTTAERLCDAITTDEQDTARSRAAAMRIIARQLFKSPASFDATDANSLRKALFGAQCAIREQSLRALFGEPLVPPREIISLDLFEPIRAATADIAKLFGTKPLLWTFAFDELENLSEEQQESFNTIIRNSSNPLVIKAASLPHGHKTLRTLGDNNPLVPGDDFEYLALQIDPKSPSGMQFCMDLYTKRVSGGRGGPSLPEDLKLWVGDLDLRGRAQEAFAETEPNKTLEEGVRQLLDPAESDPKNDDSIRQYVPVFAMRVLRHKASGNAGVAAYSGFRDIVAASDGNPRRFLRILDRLFEESGGAAIVSPGKQSEILRSVADGAFERLTALPGYGPRVRDFVGLLGSSLERRLHDTPRLLRDSCSIKLDLDNVGLLKPPLIAAIAYGVLCPWEFDSRFGYPRGPHEYSLSFSLAPRYWLVLRRGKALELTELGRVSSIENPAQLLLPLAPPRSSEEGPESP